VLATDFSTNLLGFAAQRARERGLGPTQFETRAMDGEHLVLDDAAFDIALARLGLVYVPDCLGALTEMRRVLKPGGRVAIASFTTADANRFFSVPIGIIRRRARCRHHPPDCPARSVSDYRRLWKRPCETPASAMSRLGRSTPFTASPRPPNARFERGSFGALQQMLVGLAEAEREAAWDEIERELHQFQGQAGSEAPTELIVGAGRK
jgi:SAM-dependent methyltransferase